MNNHPTEESMTPLFACPIEGPLLVSIDYTNYRGERSTRLVSPQEFSVKATAFHPEVQLIMTAFDWVKADIREFAVKDIHSWQLPSQAR